MGVLWLCRFLSFWEELCLLRAQPPTPGGETQSFKDAVEAAYAKTLLPFHGWVTQKAFDVAVQALPEWDAVRPIFAPVEADFAAEAAAYTRASSSLIARISATLAALDLVDTRKTM